MRTLLDMCVIVRVVLNIINNSNFISKLGVGEFLYHATLFVKLTRILTVVKEGLQNCPLVNFPVLSSKIA